MKLDELDTKVKLNLFKINESSDDTLSSVWVMYGDESSPAVSRIKTFSAPTTC